MRNTEQSDAIKIADKKIQNKKRIKTKTKTYSKKHNENTQTPSEVNSNLTKYQISIFFQIDIEK